MKNIKTTLPPLTAEEDIEKLKRRIKFLQGIRNPVAKELLQGDGRLGAKVVDKQLENLRKPKYGKKQWLKELDED